MKHINVETAKMSDLVSFYNAHAEALGHRTVKKFQDLATAKMRVTQMLADLEAEAKPTPDVTNRAESVVEGEIVAEDKGKSEPTPEPVTQPDVRAKISAGVTVSWDDPEVRAARMVRHHVTVDGVAYDSVAAAFKVLGIPTNKVVRFRAKLRDSGEQTFEGRKWAIVQ